MLNFFWNKTKPNPKRYDFVWNNIKTIDDLKLIIRATTNRDNGSIKHKFLDKLIKSELVKVRK
jgi:hypothetical protein